MDQNKEINKMYNIGSQTTLLICLPIGLLFTFIVLITTFFYPLNFLVAMGGGAIFWLPGSILIPLIFTYLLWEGGRKIVKNLYLKKSVLTTSFMFSLYVNSFLFLAIAVIWLLGSLFFTIDEAFILILVELGITLATYIIALITITFSIGLFTVILINDRIKKHILKTK